MPNMKKVRTLWLRQIMLFAVVYLFLVSNYWLCCARRKRNNAEETPRKKLYVVLCEDLFYFIVCIEQFNSWLYQSYRDDLFRFPMIFLNFQQSIQNFPGCLNLWRNWNNNLHRQTYTVVKRANSNKKSRIIWINMDSDIVVTFKY